MVFFLQEQRKSNMDKSLRNLWSDVCICTAVVERRYDDYVYLQGLFHSVTYLRELGPILNVGIERICDQWWWWPTNLSILLISCNDLKVPTSFFFCFSALVHLHHVTGFWFNIIFCFGLWRILVQLVVG